MKNGRVALSCLVFCLCLSTSRAFAIQVSYIWDPYMLNECLFYSYPNGYQSVACEDGAPDPAPGWTSRWIVSCAHEDKLADNPNDWNLTGVWNLWVNDLYAWPGNDAGGYRCRIGVDNWNSNYHRCKLHFTGLNVGWHGASLSNIDYPFGNLPEVTGSYQWYEISRGDLCRRVAWNDGGTNAGWGSVTLAAVYIGTEVYGAATTAVEIKHLNVFTPREGILAFK